jgi:hypothetical protein
MEVKQDTRIVGIWFVGFIGGDWMLSAYQDEGRAVKYEFRFRYYRDDLAFGSEDKKSWYEGNVPEDHSEEYMIRSFDTMMKIVASACSEQVRIVDRLLVQGNFDKMQEILKVEPRSWIHARTFKSKAEAEEFIL